MRRLKAAINILVGLLFLAQGVAAAAAPVMKPKVADSLAAMQMHCHVSQDQAASSHAENSCTCHHVCPVMASCGLCTFAPLAIGSAAPTMGAVPIGAYGFLPEEGAVLFAAPDLLLRPPITLHG